VTEDASIFERHFPGIDFHAALAAMSVDGCVPLTADLAIVGATLSMQADDLGVRFFPFTGVDVAARTCVKTPEMDNIVEWMENTALGSYMWQKASDWMEGSHGCRLEFAMDCGCGVVAMEQYANGTWREWVRRFNAVRRTVYGRTAIERRQSIDGTTMTEAQRRMWQRVRAVLEALPAVADESEAGSLAHAA
jgi:hypothetical protein